MTPARLELDYIAPRRRSLWLGVLVLAVSLCVAAAMFLRYREVRLELARMETASGLMSVERRPPRVMPKERLDQELKSAESVIRQLSLPWAALVETIEGAAMPDVAILQLQPEAQLRRLRIMAEARHREAMFRYLRRLSADGTLSDVHMVSHQVQFDDPQRPIQFAVQATMRGSP
jgi:hypothetical protein